MAFKEVVPPKEATVEFFQFKAVGDKLAGYFAGVSAAKGQYAKDGDVAVDVLAKGAEGPVIKRISPAPYTLRRAVQHAMGEGTLVPGVQVLMKLTGKRPIEGRQSEMSIISLETDLDDAGKPIVKPGVLDAVKKAAAAPPPAPKPPPPPPPAPADDDLPF